MNEVEGILLGPLGLPVGPSEFIVGTIRLLVGVTVVPLCLTVVDELPVESPTDDEVPDRVVLLVGGAPEGVEGPDVCGPCWVFTG